MNVSHIKFAPAEMAVLRFKPRRHEEDPQTPYRTLSQCHIMPELGEERLSTMGKFPVNPLFSIKPQTLL